MFLAPNLETDQLLCIQVYDTSYDVPMVYPFDTLTAEGIALFSDVQIFYAPYKGLMGVQCSSHQYIRTGQMSLNCFQYLTLLIVAFQCFPCT